VLEEHSRKGNAPGLVAHHHPTSTPLELEQLRRLESSRGKTRPLAELGGEVLAVLGLEDQGEISEEVLAAGEEAGEGPGLPH